MRIEPLWYVSSKRYSGTDRVAKFSPFFLIAKLVGSSSRLSLERLRPSPHIAPHGGPFENFFWDTRDIPGIQMCGRCEHPYSVARCKKPENHEFVRRSGRTSCRQSPGRVVKPVGMTITVARTSSNGDR